jgi:hypothetical protein
VGRTRGRDGEMRGGELQCSKGGENVCGKCAGEICSVQKVAKHVCYKFVGKIAVFKRWQQTCAINLWGKLQCSKGGIKDVL